MPYRTEPSRCQFWPANAVWTPAVAALLALTAACVGALAWQPYAATAQALANQQRDSAGIRIVENARPEDGSRLGWRIGPRPAVSIGR